MTSPDGRRTHHGAALATASVLLGSLLLFGMEPLVGRLLIPLFGSAVSTWLTALMFFQVVLFFGYLYAHVAAPRLGRWHLAVLLLAAPFVPLAIQGEVVPEAPMGPLLWALVRYVAVPFFLLSTGSVVVQSWWARSDLGAHREPYPLYAASNVGSLLALVGYPFVIEPMFGLAAQSRLWTVGFVAYVVCLAATWATLRPRPPQTVAADGAPPTAADLGLWALLAALPSGFLLAVTSVIATEVGSFPMVWILPLAAFLGTFVLLFRDRPIGLGIRGYWPEITALGLLAWAASGWPALELLVGHLALFFVFCMAVHGELYVRRPAPRWLTRYYLAISFGGGAGGAVVNFGPPVWFDGLWEYPLLVVAFGALFAVLSGGTLLRTLRDASLPVATVRVLVFQGALFVAVFGLVAAQSPLAAHRNFYGVFRVLEVGPQRLLVHGATHHGGQYLDPARADEPTAYLYEGGGVHTTFRVANDLGARRYAVIGLGAGVVGGFVDAGDTLDFYEIDPGNEALAREWFDWLDRSPASVHVYTGDGRLTLATRDGAPYDLLFLDAFNGDGIPTHLLTAEAVGVYLDRLDDDGAVLFHLSNRYYDLRPVVQALGDAHGMEVLFNPLEEPATLAEPEYWPSVCAVITRSHRWRAALEGRGWQPAHPGMPHPDTPWTDDFVDILGPLYWRHTTTYWPGE